MSSPFLDLLPPEIRLQIYSYLLVSSTPIKGTIARSFQSEAYDLHTSILCTNKQVYAEAKHVFLSLNTFHITSAPSLSGDHASMNPGSFEPPLQLKDLPLIRHLRIDLIYFPDHLHTATSKSYSSWIPPCPGADRYITSLAFLLAGVQRTLSSLAFIADTRPYTSYNTSISANEANDLDTQKFLTGFYAADRSLRFRDAFNRLGIKKVDVAFEFPESTFDFKLQTDVFLDKKLVVLAGQVLIARMEVSMRAAMEEIEACGEDGEEEVERAEDDYGSSDPEEIVVSWPFVETRELEA